MNKIDQLQKALDDAQSLRERMMWKSSNEGGTGCVTTASAREGGVSIVANPLYGQAQAIRLTATQFQSLIDWWIDLNKEVA